MPENVSVSQWICGVKAGDEAAAHELWNRYFERLVALARKKLRHANRRAADEEDVVVSAFESVYRGAREGRFRQLNDRNDLWQVLVMVTARKAVNQAKALRRLKRGGGKIRGESVFDQHDKDDGQAGIAQVVGDEPTPEFAAQVAEEYQHLLDQLDDDSLRDLALWKMEGHTNAEIAEKLGCKTRTVERRLALIRKKWSRGG